MASFLHLPLLNTFASSPRTGTASDKGKPGASRGRKASGSRNHRDGRAAERAQGLFPASHGNDNEIVCNASDARNIMTPKTHTNRRTFLSSVLSASAAAALLASLLPGSTAYAVPLADKGDVFLQRKLPVKPATELTGVIVRFNVTLTTKQQSEIASLGTVYKKFPTLNAYALRLPYGVVQRLIDLTYVARISYDAPVGKKDEFTVEHSGAGAAFAQYGLNGSGVGVAVLDSGIRPHTDFAQTTTNSLRILAAVNFASDTVTSTTGDLNGHGSHVAGIIAGNGKASTGSSYFRTFYGVARNTNLVDVRVLDAKGQGTVSGVLSGIDWAITNKTKYNIRVMNLSLGHLPGESYTTDPLCLAVEKAYRAGITVVCAAGNSGRKQDIVDPLLDNEGYGTQYGTINSPGNSPYVITVGAMKTLDGYRPSDRISTYSSRGPSAVDHVLKPDLVAPGNRVIATLANNSTLATAFSGTNLIALSEYATTTSTADSNKYFRLSGSSMAAPVVSGAVALMLQAQPTLTPDTIKARLMVSADKWGHANGQMDALTFGAGYLNIPAALTSTIVATGPALSPTLYQDAMGNLCIDATRVIWGERVIWGTGISDLRVIWGTSSIVANTSNVLSGNRVIWGTADVLADRVIWGTNTDVVDMTTTAINGEN